MKFESNIDLNEPVIHMGPYTLLTVDKGYEAVTQNNGRQEVLSGGAVHLLNHRNWKFEKFITTKIQTDDLQRISVMTGDNVLMQVDATVCWSIVCVQTCAERAAETMSHVGNAKAGGGTIKKLRNDVLKQAEASLSALVGKVNFSSTFSAATELAAAPPQAQPLPRAVPVGAMREGAAAGQLLKPPPTANALLFDVDKLQNSVQHANEMTERYGVRVMSINIISAQPADEALLQSLAKGAVAAAEKTQCVLKAQGEADAEAEVTRAEGSKTAAQLLTSEEVAVRLAVIGATGAALKGANSNLILGNDVSAIGGMLMANAEAARATKGF
jgi:regulator of protease activity HflC (stomatin/prohibitin superfamily)